MQLETQIGVSAAKRQSWRNANPRDFLRMIVENNPSKREEDLRNLHWEAVKNDETQLRAMQDYWFDRTIESLTRLPVYSKERAGEIKVKTDEIKAAITRKIEERVKIALLDMVLPTGKAVRDSTREELLTLSGWARRVADKLRPQQTVGEAGISEAELRELYES